MKVFDASLVIVGACLPDTAKIFGFRNLLEPAHGAYMIGSNGKCYHSSMTKYDKKSLSVNMWVKVVWIWAEWCCCSAHKLPDPDDRVFEVGFLWAEVQDGAGFGGPLLHPQTQTSGALPWGEGGLGGDCRRGRV